MKKSFMCLAAATAVFSLMTFTGCEDNKEENTIGKVWLSEQEVAELGGSLRVCLDMGAAHEGTVVIGMSIDDMGYGENTGIYAAMANDGYKIKSITPIDETSGTIFITQDVYGDGSVTYDDEISYSNLTENSVTIVTKLTTVIDPVENTTEVVETKYECTLAPEGTTIFNYTEFNEYLMSQMGGE